MTVHLLCTNNPSEISAPNTFQSMSPKLESGKSLGSHNDDLVTTTLSAAIDFITALEIREEKTSPENK